MVVSDEFLGSRCTLSDIDEGTPYLLRTGSWRLMYPEVTFEDDLLRPESNSASRSHHEAVTSRSNDHLGENPLITNDEDEQLLPTVRLRSFSCSPSTSSESSSEDVIVVNIRTPQAHEAKSKFKDSGYIAFSTSYGSEEQSSSRPAELQASDITHQSLWQGQSPMHGPKIQLMERDAEYEPHRIPSSVFVTGDSTTPAEWSAASNESLFSIHFGNSSFGSKRPITPSRELTKSGELLMFSPSLPSTEENCKEEIAASHEEKVMAADRTQKDIGKIYPVDQNEVKAPAAVEAVRSCGVSRHSHDSEGSACSFAFPIIIRDAVSKFSKNLSSYPQTHPTPPPPKKERRVARSPLYVAKRSVCIDERSVHAHRATVLTVAVHSAAVNANGPGATVGGHRAFVVVVAAHSATIGTQTKRQCDEGECFSAVAFRGSLGSGVKSTSIKQVQQGVFFLLLLSVFSLLLLSFLLLLSLVFLLLAALMLRK
ncbi:hypothetical protein Nepgr_017122 [Nepenthes gracilis]|uniref:Uncharacterized protein n=1 Tax=Nepenthes gracilis TaxID=150966 RepID=A0AAD3SRH1_NEPGR|nr:hypothetical protein Nepgr_017122 [Nepenthes gracilis]